MFIEHKDVKQYKYIKNCVYRFISTNGKSYIGITNNFYKRYLDHKRNTKSQSTEKIFYNACKKYGFENFKIQILKTDIKDRELLNFIEVLYIDKYRTQDTKYGYNMTSGGDGNSLFGEANGMYGKKHYEEARQKMRENCFRQVGELNAWHKSNRTQDELDKRGQTAANSRKQNLENMSEEERLIIHENKSNITKNAWKNINNNNLQKSLDALKYWEYKTPEELDAINAKKACKGIDNGRAKLFIIESPTGHKYEICLDVNLKLFCDEHNLVYRAFQVAKNDVAIEPPKRGDSKFYNDAEYARKRLNSVGWKITTHRRKDYETNV